MIYLCKVEDTLILNLGEVHWNIGLQKRWLTAQGARCMASAMAAEEKGERPPVKFASLISPKYLTGQAKDKEIKLNG